MVCSPLIGRSSTRARGPGGASSNMVVNKAMLKTMFTTRKSRACRGPSLTLPWVCQEAGRPFLPTTPPWGKWGRIGADLGGDRNRVIGHLVAQRPVVVDRAQLAQVSRRRAAGGDASGGEPDRLRRRIVRLDTPRRIVVEVLRQAASCRFTCVPAPLAAASTPPARAGDRRAAVGTARALAGGLLDQRGDVGYPAWPAAAEAVDGGLSAIAGDAHRGGSVGLRAVGSVADGR